MAKVLFDKHISKSTRIKFILSYDGTDFCGWQRQNVEREHNRSQKPSLCRTIETALEKTFKHKIELSASGRTDAGVHAVNQVCHFDTDRTVEQMQGWDLSRALINKLPDSIVIKKAWIAPPNFHSTLSAEKKTYRYLILNAEHPSPFFNRTMGWVRKPMDLIFFNETCQYLIGEHDFKSFQSVGTPVQHTVRTIYKAEWVWQGPKVAQFTITGSGFLKQMVRNIVGTQLLMARKNLEPKYMDQVIKAKDRRAAGAPADPQGLYLMKVYYPLDLDNGCREL
ncbi:MAG: tRNA pseudouridine(38-40) synthase TruA [Bdellovibrionaceae bacterium]|nr:tRNA pseudouridine(38-40) synthase TruA [Pseudobdellovibrionaceae bacterium]